MGTAIVRNSSCSPKGLNLSDGRIEEKEVAEDIIDFEDSAELLKEDGSVSLGNDDDID